MVGVNGKDLNEYLISAKWDGGIVLTFSADSYEYVRTNNILTIAGKSYPVLSCSLKDDEVIAKVRGKKFELNHFRQLNKCLD